MVITEFDKGGSKNPQVDFLGFLGGRGYKIRFLQDFFYAEATNDVTGHKILMADVYYTTTPRELNFIRGVSSEDKVIFVDFEGNQELWYSLWPVFLSAMGAYVHDTRLGWIYTPGQEDVEDLRRNLLESNERYTVVEGELNKICRKCGEILPLSGFYFKPRVTRDSLDPYRNVCKACTR